MPTASHRGIHQKINPSGISMTAISAMTHSILSSSSAALDIKVCHSKPILRMVCFISILQEGQA
jgi:hypothetical protein